MARIERTERMPEPDHLVPGHLIVPKGEKEDVVHPLRVGDVIPGHIIVKDLKCRTYDVHHEVVAKLSDIAGALTYCAFRVLYYI